MPKSPIRDHILHLAVKDSELRPHLTRILREAGGLSNEEQERLRQAEVVSQAPLIQDTSGQNPPVAPAAPVVQQVVPAQAPAAQTSPGQGVVIQQVFNNGAPAPQAPAPTTPAPSALTVPERAEHGFQVEIVPEMDKLLASGMSREQVGRDMLSLIQDSFAKKDTLYNILIRYQSSFESNEEYQENLARLIESWVTSNPGA
jgi:pyruvate/2-oxoglutarate dehydrogenase complex dihydrolipoamide acyltransferase (E2) component